MDFKHHPDCRFGTHCYTDTWGNTEQDERCLAHNAGHQAGLAAGEAKTAEAVAEERARVIAWLREMAGDEPANTNQFAQVAADALENAAVEIERAEHLTTPGASGKGEE